MIPGKKNPRKNVPQKLLSVKRMLENFNDCFIFIDWFHYTRKKMFDVYFTILHAPNFRTPKESRKVRCRVLGFHRLGLCHSFGFGSEFWVSRQVLGLHRFITSQHSTHTHHDARRSPHDFLFLSFLGLFFRGPFFPGIFSRGPFFRDSVISVVYRTFSKISREIIRRAPRAYRIWIRNFHQTLAIDT